MKIKKFIGVILGIFLGIIGGFALVSYLEHKQSKQIKWKLTK